MHQSTAEQLFLLFLTGQGISESFLSTTTPCRTCLAPQARRNLSQLLLDFTRGSWISTIPCHDLSDLGKL